MRWAAAWLLLVGLLLGACERGSRPAPRATSAPSAVRPAASVAPGVPPSPEPASSASGSIRPFPTRLPAASRVVAVGDLHGDLRAARAALRLAGLVDEDDAWTGGQAVLVQTGDLLDRGDEERELLALFERLAAEARAAGGAVHVLHGNHELMNVAGDMRYVTPAGFASFASVPGLRLEGPGLARLPATHRPRVAAFAPGAPYARKLAPHPVVLQVGRTLFVHGGLLRQHLRYGLERINQEVRAWLEGDSLRGRRLVARRDSPVWVRRWSGPPEEVECAELASTLAAARADRMVVGHTVQRGGITAACDERVWRIDVGLAAHYGGPVEVLELTPDAVRPLRVEGARR